MRVKFEHPKIGENALVWIALPAREVTRDEVAMVVFAAYRSTGRRSYEAKDVAKMSFEDADVFMAERAKRSKEGGGR